MDDVIAPPYDVIDPAERSLLVGRSEYNAVRVELPEPEGTLDRYQSAAALLAAWREAGVLRVDHESAFYAYRMSYTDEAGRPRHTTGFVGALEVSPAEAGEVLPHERTMPKPKSDRLDLLRACRANLSPVWGLSLAEGLSACCAAGVAESGAAGAAGAAGERPAEVGAVDEDGVIHEVWSITDPGLIARIRSVVGSAPVILADGHHRYETALAYRAERRSAAGDRGGPGGGGDYDLVMALVVELGEDQLAVGPIHRMLAGFLPGYDLAGALKAGFELRPGSLTHPGWSVGQVLAEAGGPALVTPEGTWFLDARPELAALAEDDLDSSRLDLALAELPEHDISYHHDAAEVVRAVADGRAAAGLLIRPATVAVIARAAGERRRLPAKSTFFTPKPRTGMVFRLVR